MRGSALARWFAAGWAAVLAAPAWAVDVRFEQVTEHVFVHVGDTGPRTVANEGLNANIGLVITPAGAILIDSGATYRTARRIHDAARKLSSAPVKWVINTGGQDHRWLGNGYYAEQGAALIAHEAAVRDMKSRGGDQLLALRTLLGSLADGTVPVLPSTLVSGQRTSLDLGGVRVEVLHSGGGHTPGDVMVWLPDHAVVFAGDIAYVDRLPAVLPVSSTRHWLRALETLEALPARSIVPGHGRVADIATVRADTTRYLVELREHMKAAVAKGADLGESVRSFDAAPFLRLRNAAELHPGNANRVYLELERE